MLQYAQTNIQLYNQLLALKYSDRELASIKLVYDLSSAQFSGLLRPNGKTFLAHLVGTASILAAHGAPLPAVAAGLMHASISHRHHSQRPTEPGESTAVEPDEAVKSIVATYTRIHKRPEVIQALASNVSELTEIEHAALLVHLANELEDYLDYGLYYCSKTKPSATDKGLAAELSNVADALGFPEFGRAIDQIVNQPFPGNMPEGLPSKRLASYSPGRDAVLNWRHLKTQLAGWLRR